jgi:hypothetical protein
MSQENVLMYVAVNTFLVLIWAVTDAGFFWPIFPILGFAPHDPDSRFHAIGGAPLASGTSVSPLARSTILAGARAHDRLSREAGGDTEIGCE